MDLGSDFSTPHLVIGLILKISKEEIGLITDVDRPLCVERSMRGGYVFQGDRILESESTGQHAGEKPNTVFLDMNSFYRVVTFQWYLTINFEKQLTWFIPPQKCKCQGNTEHKDCPAICTSHTAKSSETLLMDKGNSYPGNSNSIFHQCVVQ